MVDADSIRTATIGEALAALVATLEFILAQVGHVADIVCIRTGACVVGHHWNARIERTLNRVAEEIGVGDGNGEGIRLARNRLVDQLGHLFKIELVRAKDLDFGAACGGGIGQPFFHHAPEGIPGAERVLHCHNLDGAIGVRREAQIIPGDKAGAGRADGQCGQNAVAHSHGQRTHGAVALEIWLLVDAEQRAAIFNRRIDFGACVKGAVLDGGQARLFEESVEGIRAVRAECHHDIDIGIGCEVVADGRLRGCRVVADAQHLGGDCCFFHRLHEAGAALVLVGATYLVVDANATRTTAFGEPLAAQVTALELILANIGEVGNGVLIGAGARIEGHHRNARRNGAVDRIAE